MALTFSLHDAARVSCLSDHDLKLSFLNDVDLEPLLYMMHQGQAV